MSPLQKLLSHYTHGTLGAGTPAAPTFDAPEIYNRYLTQVDPTVPYSEVIRWNRTAAGTPTWTITGLPAGITFVHGTTDHLEGTPTDPAGDYEVSINLTTEGGTVSKVFTLTVIEV